MAEFPASAQTMVGNNSGSCLLHLTGAAITVKFPQTNDSASWPYNCIRQFRADEETRQFSFYSGRRGPYGVAEYKFDMTERMLLALQDALTQFTGAQFGQNVSAGTTPVNGAGLTPESVRSPKRDPLPQIPGTPPSIHDTQPGYTTYRGNFQQKLSGTNLFATLPPRARQESVTARPPIPVPYDAHTMGSRGRRGSPSVNTKYSYHEVSGNFPPMAGRGVSAVPGPSVGGRKTSLGDEVFSSSMTMSSPARSGGLVRQSTAPTHRFKRGFEETDSSTQSAVFSPPPADSADDDTSDLDFGLLRRSSPQVDRKNTTRRGRYSPPDTSPRHDVYSVPRPSHSPPLPATDALYQVPRSNSVDPLSQESSEPPPSFTAPPQPHGPDNIYSVPKSAGNGAGDLYSAPRPLRQQSREEISSTPDAGNGSIIYNVPTSRPATQPQQQTLSSFPGMVKVAESVSEHHDTPRNIPEQELYNSPRPAAVSVPVSTHQSSSSVQLPENGHELYNAPRAAPAAVSVPVSTHQTSSSVQLSENGHELYNVPRAALDAKQEDLYNVPRSLEPGTDLYNVPKSRSNYDSLQTVQNSKQYHANQPGGNSVSADRAASQHRQPLPTPDQETYSVPRSANPPSPVGERRAEANGRRYPYDYVDHRLKHLEQGALKSSRSLESLVRNRVSLSPDAPSQPQSQSHRTPSPRALQHKYIEIDIDELRESSPSSPLGDSTGRRVEPYSSTHTQSRSENVYAEISDSESGQRRGSHPGNITGQPTPSSRQQLMNSAQKLSAVNNTPLPQQQGRPYILQNTNAGLSSVSKEARALHEDGYELVLPAEDAARNLALKQKQAATMPMSIARTQSVSSYNRSTHHHMMTNGVHPPMGGDAGQAILGTSSPHSHRPNTDEYVIVNRRDFKQTPTLPRDIPVSQPPQSGALSQTPSTGSSSRFIVEDEYEIMSSVKIQDVNRGGRLTQFTMASSVPSKMWGFAPSSNGSPTTNSVSRGTLQSVRDSLDLESVETSSRASVGSGGHLDEPVGPLSPIDSGAPSIAQSGSGKKNVVRIASGSPLDLTSSKELKFRSNSVENILDDEDKKQKYENVTDEDIAAKHALSSSHHPQQQMAGLGMGPRKPPMPLPRPVRTEH